MSFNKGATENVRTAQGVTLENGEGTWRAGGREQESAALLRVLDLQPCSPETPLRIRLALYFDKQNFDRAALYLSRISQIHPDSAEVHFNLAVAEEARYRFADAGRAYTRALELAPDNEAYRQRYERFRERIAANANEQQSLKR